ncbi:hypothetical protein PG988_001428 [Apiospora saccharicola]
MPVQPASIDDLNKRSKKLRDTNNLFAKFLQSRDRATDQPHLEIACFFEELPMRYLPTTTFVVPKESATWIGNDPQSIQANHVNMCKFQSEFGSDYKKVAGKLSEWVNNIEENKKKSKKGGVGGVNAEVSRHRFVSSYHT